MHSKKPKLALFREGGEEQGEPEQAEVQAIPLPPSSATPGAPPSYQDAVSVEDFGLAMLRGMGFRGEPSAPPCLLEGRPALLGLGAGLALQAGTRQFICRGSVCQVRGTHRFAVVRQADGVPGQDMVRVALLAAGGGALEELVLPRAQLVLQDMAQLPETHPARQAAAQIERLAETETATAPKTTWLRPGLRVLVAQPKSAWFKHKGWVARVDADGRCIVKMDGEGEHEFKQRHLQTSVQVGRPALLLARPGALVGLVEDKDKLRALVRLPSGEPEWLSLDDVCEVVEET